MGVSDRIETFILELLSDEDDWLRLKRNELAEVFGCAPSQINYVIATRFTPEKGYAVQSRRGGGGYVMIRRTGTLERRIEESIGQSLDAKKAAAVISGLFARGALTSSEAAIMAAAVSADVVKSDEERSALLKSMVRALADSRKG